MLEIARTIAAASEPLGRFLTYVIVREPDAQRSAMRFIDAAADLKR